MPRGQRAEYNALKEPVDRASFLVSQMLSWTRAGARGGCPGGAQGPHKQHCILFLHPFRGQLRPGLKGQSPRVTLQTWAIARDGGSGPTQAPPAPDTPHTRAAPLRLNQEGSSSNPSPGWGVPTCAPGRAPSSASTSSARAIAAVTLATSRQRTPPRGRMRNCTTPPARDQWVGGWGVARARDATRHTIPCD